MYSPSIQHTPAVFTNSKQLHLCYIYTLEVEGETLKHLCYLVEEQRETSKSVSGRGDA